MATLLMSISGEQILLCPNVLLLLKPNRAANACGAALGDILNDVLDFGQLQNQHHDALEAKSNECRPGTVADLAAIVRNVVTTALQKYAVDKAVCLRLRLMYAVPDKST